MKNPIILVVSHKYRYWIEFHWASGATTWAGPRSPAYEKNLRLAQEFGAVHIRLNPNGVRAPTYTWTNDRGRQITRTPV